MTEKELIRLISSKPVDFWELIKNQYHIKDIVGKVKSLQKKDLIEINNSTLSFRIPLSGMRNPVPPWRDANNNTRPTAWISPPPRRGRDDKQLLNEFSKLRKKFTLSDSFDQQLLTEEAIFTKLNIMSEQGDLKNKNIVCIGDDDMFAIALALTKLPKSITVLDIDDRIINYENKILNKLGYKNSSIKTDLLKPLSTDLVG